MRPPLIIVGSVIAVAGLVNEGINARRADPFSVSAQSIAITFLFALLLFVVNLKPFKTIKLNVGSFDFDSHFLGGNMFLATDRSRDITKALGITHIPPPKD